MAELLSTLAAARRELLDAVEGLTDEELARKHSDGWSARDILAHVAMWDELELLEMRRSARGGVAIFEHRFDRSLIDRWNEVQFCLRSHLTPSQIYEDLRIAREDVVGFLTSLDSWKRTPFIMSACTIQAKHDRDHATQIRGWRKQEDVQNGRSYAPYD